MNSSLSQAEQDFSPETPHMSEAGSRSLLKLSTQISTHKTTTGLDLECIAVKDTLVFVADISGCIYQFQLDSFKATRSLLGHEARVTCLVISDCILYSSSEDSTLKLWDIDSGECVRTIKGHGGAVLSLCITADNRIYTGGIDKTICEWSVQGRRKWVLTGSTSAVSALASSFSIPNRLFSADNTLVRSWDTTSGRCVHTFSHDEQITCIYLHNSLLFTSTVDGKIIMWHAQDGTLLAEFQHESRLPIRGMCIIQNRLYSAGESKTIVCWNMETYSPLETLRGHQGVVTGLGYSPLKNALISSSADGTFKVWYFEKKTVPILHRAASFNGSYISTRRLNHTPSVTGLSEISIDSIHSLQEQLLHTQDLLSKQERNKLRLKGELTGAQQELNRVKMELLDAKKKLEQTEAVVNELEAAKELLVTYSSDLQSTQEAHAVSLDFILRSCDRQYQATALELAAFQKLVRDRYSLAFRDKKQKRIIPDRKWEFDEDWDSDRDIPDEDCWWRKLDPSDPLSEYFITDVVKKEPELMNATEVVKTQPLENPNPKKEPEPADVVKNEIEPIKRAKVRRRQSVSDILLQTVFPKEKSPKKDLSKRKTIHVSQLPSIPSAPISTISGSSAVSVGASSVRIPVTEVYQFDQPSIDGIEDDTLLGEAEETPKIVQDPISALFRRKSVADLKRQPSVADLKMQVQPPPTSPQDSQQSNNTSWSFIPSWFKSKEP